MSIYDAAKDAANILKESGKIKEYEKILDLLAKLLDMQDEIAELKDENKSLKEKFLIKENLVRENNAYWNGEDGPLCLRCWDKNKETMHMIPIFLGSNISRCPECKTEVNVTGKNDAVPERPIYKLNKTNYK